jgi:hypothetical protein
MQTCWVAWLVGPDVGRGQDGRMGNTCAKDLMKCMGCAGGLWLPEMVDLAGGCDEGQEPAAPPQSLTWDQVGLCPSLKHATEQVKRIPMLMFVRLHVAGSLLQRGSQVESS